jgi:hypothetical protein
MATRRKYRDGGRVPVIDNIIVAPPVETPIAAPPADDGNPLVRAHAAQMRAEEIQRNAAKQPQSIAGRPPTTIDEHIDAMPISEHKKAFLRANPNFLEPDTAKQVHFHYSAALGAGVVDDTPQMNERILDGIKRERERAVQDARSVVEAAAAPPRRPSVQVSAPVSRAAPTMSGRREPDGQNTLSPEERDIARRSIIDRPDMPKMSDSEKEYQYLQNRNRYRAMLADGSYSEQTK